MSVRRRASIAGLDFKNDFTYQSAVSGNGFGRRMSIASLGSHKYGRAEDVHSNIGGGGGGGALVVRHIPIVIEGEEDHKNLEPGSSPSHILKTPVRSEDRSMRSEDRSSTSSTESDNSVEASSRSGVQRDRLTLASVRKSANPKYVVVEETVGADHCPVHGHHHHHHHHHHHYSQEEPGKRRQQSGGKGVAHDHQTQVFADQLKAPSLIRSSVTPAAAGEDNNYRKLTTSSHRVRPKQTSKSANYSLGSIKEKVSLDNFQRHLRHGGSFREPRRTKLGEEVEDKLQGKTFQRRWSVRQSPPGEAQQSRQEARAPSSSIVGKTGGGDEAAQAVRQGQAQPCVGILKTPGKRKTSNNRVEFLDNLQEREIPGRHT